MPLTGQALSALGLESHGITNVQTVYWTLGTPALYEKIVERREGVMAHQGPIVCRTGQHTGRSPNDKFIVREPSSDGKIWWGKVNRPIGEEQFEALHARMLVFLQGKELFVQDCYAGADERYRVSLRVITEAAWHSLFARNLFIREKDREVLARHVPEFTVIDAPQFHADPKEHGTNSEVFIIVHFGKKLVLIGGTAYAGEIKKSVFTLLNYLLPLRGVLSMHCSANLGPKGDVALFFGLSGTGKTTLSSDPERMLIGDDEHGWSDYGVFNLEGGCYAKVIRLSQEAEPQIYATTRKFGTILENVTIDALTRHLNLDDESLTENTRGAYPICHIPSAVLSGTAGHPSNLVMLTADAFGVMPPIARLTPAQAKYHFLSGYTAKVAGTERGVKEPQATFSTCFGAPFMALHPNVYAKFLGDKIARHQVKVWLVNTGWTGGRYGEGQRMKIAYTRAMIRAALGGLLDDVPYTRDPNFDVEVPLVCPEVPTAVLKPRSTWADPHAYDLQAGRLANMFRENFKQFADSVSAEVREAGPQGA